MSKDVKECKVCKLGKQSKEFFGKELCYKCEYQRKIAMKPLQKRTTCTICDEILIPPKRTYCSKTCLNAGKYNWYKNNWRSQMNYDTTGSKRRFNRPFFDKVTRPEDTY